jgi:hypothetical protein
MKISIIDRHTAAEMLPRFPLPGSSVPMRRDLFAAVEGLGAAPAGTDRFVKFSKATGLTGRQPVMEDRNGVAE